MTLTRGLTLPRDTNNVTWHW